MVFGPEVTDDLDEPYSQRVSAPLPPTMPPTTVGVDGRAYLLDTSENKYRRVGVEVLQQRNTNDNRDLLLLPQNVWRQSINSWHQGAGQSNLDRDNALPYRYSRSYGINPWEWWEISLLKETADLGISPNLDPLFLVINGDHLVACQTTTTLWYEDTPDTPVSLTVGTTAIIDAVSDGDNVITLHETNGNVYKSLNETTTALYQSHVGATFIGYNKDYLITNEANVLWNITGTPAMIYTHPNTGFRWVDACDGDSAIYVLGGSGDQWVIHRVGIMQDGTGLIPPIVAAALPDGEIGYSIGSYLGFIFIGTNKGVRMAAADANGDLTLGAIIPTSAPVYCFEGQDKFVWYGNSVMDGVYPYLGEDVTTGVFPTGNAVGLGRMDLSTFTVTALTPAYANDLVATGVTIGATRSVVTFHDKRVFSIDNGGVFYETDNCMPGGWVEGGVLSFSVEDNKTALYMQGKWQPLEGSVLMDMSFDSTGFTRYGEFEVQGSIKSDNVSLNGTVFSRAEPRIVLLRQEDDLDCGPVFTRWELRARAARGKASRWFLPIVNHETLDILGVQYNRNPLDEYDRLMELVESGVMFLYQENRRSYQCTAVDFEWVPQTITQSGNAWEGVYTLVIEEVT